MVRIRELERKYGIPVSRIILMPRTGRMCGERSGCGECRLSRKCASGRGTGCRPGFMSNSGKGCAEDEGCDVGAVQEGLRGVGGKFMGRRGIGSPESGAFPGWRVRRPRGGASTASPCSRRTGRSTLIVDDIVDSGRTIEPF